MRNRFWSRLFLPPLRRGRLLAVPAAFWGIADPAGAADAPTSLTPVPIRDVKIDDAFWSPKIAVWRATTLTDVFGKFETHGAFRNFDRVATRQSGGHQGEPWWDGLVYETITGCADFLANHPDPKLLDQVDGYIARIAAAAAVDADGYVNTGVTLDQIGVRWSNPPGKGFDDGFAHTVYNAGCLVEAAVHYYQATGRTELLKVATRMANYMTGIMGPPPRQNIVPGHAISELAFVELYQLYRDEPGLKEKVGLPVVEGEYLKLAEFWIEARGHAEGRDSRGAYNQDDVSVFKQPGLEGHAVRSLLLAAGIAAAAEVNHRDDYRETVARWWANMAQAKMYVTGGMGSVPSIEGFGPDYELPNDGYNETCASVGAGFFSGRMNLLTGDAKYVDVLERELYNGALSGVSLEGNSYFYTNLLAAGPDHRRWGWKSGAVNITPCCPPMFLKLQGALPGYLYATDGAGIYVNLYAGSTARIRLKSGEARLKQTTRYPWEGTVELVVTPESPAAFPVNLRVPGWAKGAEVAVNGEAVKAETFDHYLRLERTWKAGDVVTLRLPMPVERVKADERVKANVGRVALMRGPVVYCLEGVDNKGQLGSLQIPAGGEIHAEFQPGLLGGVTTLKGPAVRMREQAGEVQGKPAEFTAIPFFANSNRAPTDMAVWIADEASQVRPVTIAGESEPTASHCFGNDTVRALNDGLVPKSSDDESVPRMTWWDHRGTPEWAQLTFATAQTIQGAEVYWWDERRVGRDCRVPEKWTLQYRDGEEWKTVEDASGFGTEVDAFNAVSFKPVTTTALRIAVQLQPNWSGGILEWRLRDSAPAR